MIWMELGYRYCVGMCGICVGVRGGCRALCARLRMICFPLHDSVHITHQNGLSSSSPLGVVVFRVEGSEPWVGAARVGVARACSVLHES